MANSMTELAVAVRGLDRSKAIDAVVERLLEIERELDGYLNPDRGRRRLRRRPDGVACFNYMYLRVTQRVGERSPEFEAPAFVQRLAVVFAEFYLQAYDAAKAGDAAWVSNAWAPLFRRRKDRRVRPLQFALAGMNAHINNDLPWALMQVWNEFDAKPSERSPQFRDFNEVNQLLDAAQAEVRATLETWWQRLLNRLLGRLDNVAAAFVVSRARDVAWDRGSRWVARFDGTGWAAPLDEEGAHAHEQTVGYASNLILAA